MEEIIGCFFEQLLVLFDKAGWFSDKPIPYYRHLVQGSFFDPAFPGQFRDFPLGPRIRLTRAQSSLLASILPAECDSSMDLGSNAIVQFTIDKQSFIGIDRRAVELKAQAGGTKRPSRIASPWSFHAL
jgi:hypothetical protein